MTSGARDQHRHRRVPRVLRWLLRPFRKRTPEMEWAGVMHPAGEWAGRPNKRQMKIDAAFWGLIHDHDWIQYDHRRPGQPPGRSMPFMRPKRDEGES